MQNPSSFLPSEHSIAAAERGNEKVGLGRPWLASCIVAQKLMTRKQRARRPSILTRQHPVGFTFSEQLDDGHGMFGDDMTGQRRKRARMTASSSLTLELDGLTETHHQDLVGMMHDEDLTHPPHRRRLDAYDDSCPILSDKMSCLSMDTDDDMPFTLANHSFSSFASSKSM